MNDSALPVVGIKDLSPGDIAIKIGMEVSSQKSSNPVITIMIADRDEAG
jgi:hypothetical protein